MTNRAEPSAALVLEWALLAKALELWAEYGRGLLDTWAKRTWWGRLSGPLTGNGQRSGLEDRALLKCEHVEGFWRSTQARQVLREHCLREFAEFGVPLVSHCLDDVDAKSQMVAEFCEWLDRWPMPVIHHIPIDDDSGHAANEVQAITKKITAGEVASMLSVDIREAQRLLGDSRILGYKTPSGDWVTTVADVLDYWVKRTKRGGARPGAGRPKRELEHDEQFVSIDRSQGAQTARMKQRR